MSTCSLEPMPRFLARSSTGSMRLRLNFQTGSLAAGHLVGSHLKVIGTVVMIVILVMIVVVVVAGAGFCGSGT